MTARKLITTAALIVGALAATPLKASADGLVTPYVGWNWGGSANFINFDNFDDKFEQRAGFGVSLGWMSAGVMGLEADFGFTPNFFQNTVGPGNFRFGDSNVTTLMGNLIIGVPIGGQQGLGFRPYVVGGVGLVRSSVTGPANLFKVSANDWGVNFGAGAMLFFTDHFGLRGDVRYFRSLTDTEPDNLVDVGFGDFQFWRGTAGVTFRW